MSFVPSLTPAFNDINIITQPTTHFNETNLRDMLDAIDNKIHEPIDEENVATSETANFDQLNLKDRLAAIDSAIYPVTKFSDYAFWDICKLGCALSAPTGSEIAYRRCLANGNNIFGVEVRTTMDFNTIVFESDTLDETTTGSGNVLDKTTNQIKNVSIESNTFYGSGHEIMTLNEMLRIFKDEKCLFVIEAKNGYASKHIKKYCIDHNISKDRIILCVPVLSLDMFNDMIDAKTIWGFTTALKIAFSDDAGTIATNLSYVTLMDPDYILLDADCSNATISTYQGSTKPVVLYTKNRRYERDRAVSLGCKGMMTDGAEYITKNIPYSFTDKFYETHDYMSGMIGWNDQRSVKEMGEVLDGGYWGWSTAPSARDDGETLHAVLQGWACPLTDKMGSYTTINIDYSIVITTSTDTTRWGGIYLHLGSMGDRQVVDHTTNNTAYEDFFLFLQRKSGVVDIYYRDGGGVTPQITNSSDGALTINSMYNYRVSVSATSYTFSRLTTPQGSTTVWSYTNGHIKGLPDYFSFGNRGQALRFYKVRVWRS